jgi:hypothetical protein
MKKSTAGPYRSEPHPGNKGRSGLTGTGNIVAGARACWHEAVAGIPGGEYGKKIIVGAEPAMTNAHCGVCRTYLIAPSSLESDAK